MSAADHRSTSLPAHLTVAALSHPGLVPHRSDDPSAGSTMLLRAAMARFSSGDDHAPRRREVESMVERLDPGTARTVAAERATARLDESVVDALASIARVVPTETLGTLLGLGDLDSLVADIERVVSVIGRGRPADAASDAATDRLLARAEPLGDPVAVLSMLYQNVDATAALIAVELAGRSGADVGAAVPRTRRLAVDDVELDGSMRIAAGDEVAIELAAAGLPFGAGPHECPGRVLATAIVEGVLDAVTAGGYAVDTTTIELDADRRPTVLRLAR